MLLIDVQERIEQAAKNLGLNPTFTHSGDLAQVLTVHHAGKSIGIKFPRKELEYGETSSAKMIAHKISIAEKFLRSTRPSFQAYKRWEGDPLRSFRTDLFGLAV